MLSISQTLFPAADQSVAFRYSVYSPVVVVVA